MKEKACKECGKLTDGEVCPICRSSTSTDWLGYVAIADPEKSEIAGKLNLKVKGRYALRVR